MADAYWQKLFSGYQEWDDSDWYSGYEYEDDYTTLFSGEDHGDPIYGRVDSGHFAGEDHGEVIDYELQSFLDMHGTTEEEFNALGFGEPGMEAWDIQPEEQSYAGVAREWIDKIAPWLGGAAKLQKFAKAMTTQRRQQGRGGGDGRQMRSPYTTHRAGSAGRVALNLESSFKGRNSKELMAMLSQQSRQASTGVQIVANKAAEVGKPVSGNDLYDLMSGETKPRGAKQQLPTGQSFRSLAVRRRSQMA